MGFGLRLSFPDTPVLPPLRRMTTVRRTVNGIARGNLSTRGHRIRPQTMAPHYSAS